MHAPRALHSRQVGRPPPLPVACVQKGRVVLETAKFILELTDDQRDAYVAKLRELAAGYGWAADVFGQRVLHLPRLLQDPCVPQRDCGATDMPRGESWFFLVQGAIIGSTLHFDC